MSNFDNGLKQAQEAYDRQLPLEGSDYLENKPEGFCPWCDTGLVENNREETDGGLEILMGMVCGSCEEWDWNESEDDNRARYAKECEERSDVCGECGQRKCVCDKIYGFDDGSDGPW